MSIINKQHTDHISIIDDKHMMELKDKVDREVKWLSLNRPVRADFEKYRGMIKVKPFGPDSEPLWILLSDISASIREYQLKKLDI
ncbi:hypothetical protein UFOVP639_31 [uncultured Caudovirales phage]|uniref:Uncharacterized protein n=1 Tax=uncultured Caudovirales phage TaxID=2100421 RepID=A0A6J5N9L9_9CAUD|nr:hypothetical protein UFOVP639_31 [uncultured Caudovirales phage]